MTLFAFLPTSPHVEITSEWKKTVTDARATALLCLLLFALTGSRMAWSLRRDGFPFLDVVVVVVEQQ